MQKGILEMSEKEVKRLEIISQVTKKTLTQKEASRFLGISPRHIKRLSKAYRMRGAKGLISKQRGKKSNHCFSLDFKCEVRKKIESDYYDFGPTFASEKLLERDSLAVNKETLRQWMIEWGLWEPKRKKVVVLHQSRERRHCFGELIQIDGSPHDWFEGRSPKCCLIVFIDDATSKIVQLRFEPSETTLGYFRAAKDYFKRYGLPLTFYSDKHSIFRVNRPDAAGGKGKTEFERAMGELGINTICASTAEAKGRVEKANRTLQDRLIKEMRLLGINDMDEANGQIEKLMATYNKIFAKPPAKSTDLHRMHMPEEDILDVILSEQHSRSLSKQLEFSFKNCVYQIQTKGHGYALRRAKVKICKHCDGKTSILYKNRFLDYKILKQHQNTSDILSSKEINQRLDFYVKVLKRAGKYEVTTVDPWQQYAAIVHKNKNACALVENAKRLPQGTQAQTDG